jgi:hypothetical protein
MPRPFIVLVVCLVTVAAAGCLQPSLSPLIPPDQSRFDDRLIGAWSCGSDVWTFTRADVEAGLPPSYRVDIRTSDAHGELAGWIGRVDDRDYVNFMADDQAQGVPFVRQHLVDTFSFGLIAIDGTHLHIAMLSDGWVRHEYEAGRLEVGVSRELSSRPTGDDAIVLTAGPPALQAFVRRAVTDDQAFADRFDFERVSADTRAQTDATNVSCGQGR